MKSIVKGCKCYKLSYNSSLVSMHKSFGKHLREERKRQSLTAETLAKTCGISRSYIALIENEKRFPGKKILPRLATALNIKTTIVLNWYLEDISNEMQKNLKIT